MNIYETPKLQTFSFTKHSKSSALFKEPVSAVLVNSLLSVRADFLLEIRKMDNESVVCVGIL